MNFFYKCQENVKELDEFLMKFTRDCYSCEFNCARIYYMLCVCQEILEEAPLAYCPLEIPAVHVRARGHKALPAGKCERS